MWSPAYTGFLSSGAQRGVGGGNQTEGDSWMLWRSHRSRCSQANAQGDEGTDPNPEARAARATPPSPGPRSPPARVRRRQTLSFPSPEAARWVPGSPVRVSGGFSPITNRVLGRRAGGG